MAEEPAVTPEATPPPPPELWRVVLGGLSFVLGLVSCLTCYFGIVSGIPAILLGIGARVKLPRTGLPVPGVRMAKSGIVLGSIGLTVSVAAMLIMSQLVISPEHRNRVVCQNNLKQIGVSLKMYAQSHDGALPDKLSALYPEFVADPNVFICPTSGKKPGDPARIDEWCDYTLVPGLRDSQTSAAADVLVCYDSQYSHTPPGRDELYLDGHVEFRKQNSTRAVFRRGGGDRRQE